MKSVKNLLKLLEEPGVIQPGWELKRVLAFGDESPIKETVIEYESAFVLILGVGLTIPAVLYSVCRCD